MRQGFHTSSCERQPLYSSTRGPAQATTFVMLPEEEFVAWIAAEPTEAVAEECLRTPGRWNQAVGRGLNLHSVHKCVTPCRKTLQVSIPVPILGMRSRYVGFRRHCDFFWVYYMYSVV